MTALPTGRLTAVLAGLPPAGSSRKGAVKTTTLRMVNRLVEPTRGQDPAGRARRGAGRPAALRRGIGYVIQQTGLFPHRTVEDNIATVPLLNGWRRAGARARARELMELVGLDAAAEPDGG